MDAEIKRADGLEGQTSQTSEFSQGKWMGKELLGVEREDLSTWF